MAAVDTKRGYMGVCNGRSAQQESGAALSKNSMFTAGPKIIYSYYTRCALIRDCRPTACMCSVIDGRWVDKDHTWHNTTYR